MLRKLVVAVVTLLALAVAALPIVLTVVFHWDRTRFLASTLGKGSGILFILAVVYAVWLPATVVGLVYMYDLLGLHFTVTEREKRPSRRQRRRTRAGVEFLRSWSTCGDANGVPRSGGLDERSRDGRGVRG